jgi:hypothetical protein
MKSIASALIAGALVASIGRTPAPATPLPRTNVVLASATSVDLEANTVTLPLHKGTAKGATVWYILTDASDSTAASKLGLLFFTTDRKRRAGHRDRERNDRPPNLSRHGRLFTDARPHDGCERQSDRGEGRQRRGRRVLAARPHRLRQHRVQRADRRSG